MLKGASNFDISGKTRLYEVHGDAIINYQTDTSEWIEKHQLVTNLPRVQAGLSDYETTKKIGPCFPGTRKALLQEMMNWVINSDESRLYALSGLAGIGKSTVVYTVATQADECGLLGASFFFSRDEVERRSAKRLFSTIAYQLCIFNEEFARAIAGALGTERGSAATTGSPDQQLDGLILDPLRAILTSNSESPQTLIVVDALDECDDGDAPSVLTGLCRLVQALPSFKVILTSRPHPLLGHVFAAQKSNKIFHLQDIEDKIVNNDIRLYLKYSLSQEQVRERLEDPTEDWYASDMQIEALVLAAGKLFIIASMAVRFILDEYLLDPAGRIEELLRAFAQNHTPFDNLCDFYTIILRRAVPVATCLEERYQADCWDTRLVERYQAVVGTIVLSPVPLSIKTLAALVGVKAKQVSVVLRQLQSIIMVGSDDIPIIYHQSLVDYITDLERCKDENHLINISIRHTWTAIRCFEMMDKHLKYNILGLGNVARFMRNEDGLAKDGIPDERLQKMIPPELQFACAHWADHLRGADNKDVGLTKELEEFANTHVLHWIEALSLIKKLDSAHRALGAALKFLKPAFSDLRQFLSDGLRFISKFYQIIERSALHTYYSALPFTPTDSLLYRQYIKEASHNVCEVYGVPKRWEPLVANLNHGEVVDWVRFSLDNTMFASWTEEGDDIKGELKIWDATTGTPISAIRGSGFAIANDFSTIVSYRDSTVTLHDANGIEQGPAIITEAVIVQVAISSENRRIAGRLSNGTVCLWDSSEGELVGKFGDYESASDNWVCLEFTATGARLAYMSAIGIKLRDGIDGRYIADLDCGSCARVELSHNGSRIVTLRSKILKLWNCENGQLVGLAKKAGSELAISANGSLLATKAGGKVKLWSGNNGNPLLLVEALDIDLHLYWMTFSLDDTLAIATDLDIRLYNVKNHSFVSTLSFRGDIDETSLAFSPDCTHLAAGNGRGTIYLWDIQGMERSSASSSKEASGPVTALASSRDCSRIVCGFLDGAIELWKIDGHAKQRIAAQRYHTKEVTGIGFSPDDRQYASGSENGTINLWDSEEGMLRGTLQYPNEFGSLFAVKVSNSVLAAVGDDGIILWDRKTLDRIHSFEGSFMTPLSFSADDALLAAGHEITSDDGTASNDEVASDVEATSDYETTSDAVSDDDAGDPNPDQIVVFDVTKGTTIATFDISNSECWEITFLPDNSRLVVQPYNDGFLTFSLINKEIVQQLSFEDIVQLPTMSLWRGVPVWVDAEGERYYLRALFSQHDDPVPLLWIPRELHVYDQWAQSGSKIALCCEGGRVNLLLQLQC